VKILMFATVTALSLGAGAAMAQEGGSTYYPLAPNYAAPKAAEVGQVQSGTSDVTPANPASVIPNWRDAPTFGGQG
jgi:hypothetical protein